MMQFGGAGNPRPRVYRVELHGAHSAPVWLRRPEHERQRVRLAHYQKLLLAVEVNHTPGAAQGWTRERLM
jgi:hypothetical protein